MIDTAGWLAVALAVPASGLLLRWIIASAGRLGMADVPNHRSSHSSPVPKGGGAAFVIPVGIALLGWFWLEGLLVSVPLAVFWLGAMLVGVTGWLDDRHEISPWLRFGAESVAALAVIGAVSGLDSFYLPYAGLLHLGAVAGGALAFVWITGTVNIYNFMDGVDGMAAQQGIAAALGWACLAWMWEIPAIVIINLLILACLLPFLWYNLPPARIFMGDTGSLYLGFVFAAMPLLAAALTDTLPVGDAIWFGALMIWPSLFDGSLTLLRRLWKGENLLKPHRTHLYQRLHIAGWPQGRVSLLYFGFSMVSAVAALLFVEGGHGLRTLILGGVLAGSLLYLAFVGRVERRSGAV